MDTGISLEFDVSHCAAVVSFVLPIPPGPECVPGCAICCAHARVNLYSKGGENYNIGTFWDSSKLPWSKMVLSML